MPKTAFAIGAVVLLSTTYAMAQQGAVIRECAADIRAACGDVLPGAGAVRSCLNSHLRTSPSRVGPYWSELRRLRTNAAATSERCVETCSPAAAELRLVYTLTSPTSAHRASMSWHELWAAGDNLHRVNV
jgi:hypothetical protein